MPRLRSSLLWLGKGAVVLLALTLLPVLWLRWLEPPGSAFMWHAQHAARTQGHTLDIHYGWTDWDFIAPEMKLAVVAAEDQRFPLHSGFDLEAIQQAWQEMHEGTRVRGASTITQQTAKNLFLWPTKSLLRKGLEAYVTLLIEGLWSKRRVLEMYLNVAEFGPGIYGVGAAAERFFDTDPHRLTPEEAALLAAVLPNPQGLSVAAPSSYVRERQRWILKQMRHLGGNGYLEAL